MLTALSRRKRSISAILLVVFVLLHLPIPAPRVVVSKSSDIPFLCQTSACGCASALQCYTNCCCHSLDDRVRFANEHGVDLSQFGFPVSHVEKVSVAKREGSTCCAARLDAPETKIEKSCCSTVAKVTNCELMRDTKQPLLSCCNKNEDNQNSIVSSPSSTCEKCKSETAREKVAADSPKLGSQKSVRKALVWQAYLQCHGLNKLWTLFSCCLVFSNSQAPLALRPMVESIAIFDLQHASISLDLDTPPPRQRSA